MRTFSAFAFAFALTGSVSAQVPGLTDDQNRQLSDFQKLFNAEIAPKIGTGDMPVITHIPGPCGNNASQYWDSNLGMVPCSSRRSRQFNVEQLPQFLDTEEANKSAQPNTGGETITLGPWGSSNEACQMHANPEAMDPEFSESNAVIVLVPPVSRDELTESHGTCMIPDQNDLADELQLYLTCSSEGILSERTAIYSRSLDALKVFESFGGSTIYAPCEQRRTSLSYGSRAGMEVEVIGSRGIDTKFAEIRTRHTASNAKEYCGSYLDDPSQECVRTEMSEVRSDGIRDRVIANCKSGVFYDLFNNMFRFEGRNNDVSARAEYVIRSIKHNTILDGSSSSDYPVVASIFQALCPSRAPS